MVSSSGRRILAAALFVVVGELAACGGGGSDPDTGGDDPGGPVGTSFPTDFSGAYIAPGEVDDDVYLVRASQLDTSVQVSRAATGKIDDSVVVMAGEWSGGKASNSRPAQFVYSQAGQLWRLDLRSGTSATPTALGRDSQQFCYFAGVWADDAVTTHSFVFYSAAGTDGSCYGDDDEIHAFRLDDSPLTSPHVIGPSSSTSFAMPLRVFYSSTGSISGFVVGVHDELRYYDASLITFKTLRAGATGSSFGRAGAFARTMDTAYIRYQDAETQTSHIERVKSDGTSSPIYSEPNTRFGSGYSDENALYVVARPASGGTHIVRVPYDGSQTHTLYSTSEFVTYIAGVTSKALVIVVSTSTGIDQLMSIEKISGSTVKTIAEAGYGFFGATLEGNLPTGTSPFVSADRIVWTAYADPSGQGAPSSSRAGISKDDGTQVELYERSEWINQVNANADFTLPRDVGASSAALVRGYTGAEFQTTGDQGGTIAYYDFLSGNKQDVDTVPDSAFIQSSFLPVGLTAYQHLPTSGRSDTDVIGFDLLKRSVTQLTDTVFISEEVP
ncbi:MAG: hypothetical protein JWQ90_498 [Hydrocarboniphaga sp.]|uniref:hypothetical protein n=1 Tax=Hydrocarboniphaga sp. TaxID=2033016 RepID=UPI00260AB680|nr:hypothetical protein [Hydrocarboniphaga sp.]MDB5968048.1 hypothetical protein [Hydrocarboniphaga sp.]